MNYYVIFVIVFFGIIITYLSLIAFTDFSMSDLFPPDGSLDCRYWTEKGIWRNCVEFD